MDWVTIVIVIAAVLVIMKIVGCTVKMIIKVGIVLVAICYVCSLLGININDYLPL